MERIDFERLNAHDLTVMRSRVSFSPDEIGALVDKIEDLSEGPDLGRAKCSESVSFQR